MLLTYLRICEQLARGDIMKTGLLEKSSFENRVKSQSTEKNK